MRIENLFQTLVLILTLALLSGCVGVMEKLPHRKWGFIDKSGKMVIEAKFDDVTRDQFGGCTQHHKPFRNFSEGLCGVRVGNKWGYINQKGEFAIPSRYDNAGNFSEGLAFVRLGTKYGYIDKAGKEIIPLQFDLPATFSTAANANPDWDMTQGLIETYEFSEGLAVAVTGSKAGYIDKAGHIVIEQNFSRAEPFFDGLASVTLDNGAPYALGKTYINKSGTIVAKASENCFDYSEGMFVSHNGKFDAGRRMYYLDKNGKRVNTRDYSEARNFSEDLAVALPITTETSKVSSKYGYIDKTGDFVIAPIYEIYGNNLAGNFQNGRAIVQLSKVADPIGNIKILHGVIDRKARMIVEPRYDHISAYREGLARAFDNNQTIYLDMDGKVAIRTKYVWGNSFSEGLAAVMSENK
jgi:hypothetical protein